MTREERTFGLGLQFVADVHTAPLLPGGVSINFAAFTDPKFGAAGSRHIPAGTVVMIADNQAVPYGTPEGADTTAAFATGTAYAVGDHVTANGKTYLVTKGGNSGAEAPAWSEEGIGSSTKSGTVTFVEVDVVGNNTDTPRAYITASAANEGGLFLYGSQHTTGLYMGGTIVYEDKLPDADADTHELPAALRTAVVNAGFRLTKSFFVTEVNA